MNQTLKKTMLVLSPLLFLACGGGDSTTNETSTEAPTKIEGKLVVDFPASAVKAGLIDAGVIESNRTVYGYKAYKIPYVTTDEEGNSVNVSGLLVIPTGLPEPVKDLGLSMVSDGHGTIFANNKAPSVTASKYGVPDGSSVILTSLGAFATLQPDYIGFGDSREHYHPFILKDSLANATVDFIKQVKLFTKEQNIKLNNQLFLTGYSEGGYSSMAALKKIEEEDLSDLAVTLAAPMAGPYTLKEMADSILTQERLLVPSFMANFGYAYAKAHDEAIDSVINEPYASMLENLLNGDLNRTQIDGNLTTLTTSNEGLFSQDFVSNYLTQDDFWFKRALVKNTLHNWAPTTPIRLVHCKGDNVIPYAISELTQQSMQSLGASDVELIPVEQSLGLPTQLGHGECGLPAYAVTTKMFAKIRKQTIGY